MIKVVEADGSPAEPGRKAVRDIVKRRVDLSQGLIAGDALDLAIEKTGGALRDLFEVLTAAAGVAVQAVDQGRQEEAVTLSDVRYGLNRRKSYILRGISVIGMPEEYGSVTVNELYERLREYGESAIPNPPSDLVNFALMQAHALIEYNGERWYPASILWWPSMSYRSQDHLEVDTSELGALLEFLEEVPGRLSAVEVAGPVITRELVERIRVGVSLPVETIELCAALELADAVSGLAEHDAVALVSGLDVDRPFESDSLEKRFWQNLNYQRERLAAGRVRCCLFLSPRSYDRLAALAPDLWSWVRSFSFLSVPVRVGGVERDRSPETNRDRLVPSTRQLAVLRSQFRRARESGISEGALVRDFAAPLMEALADAGYVHEATAMWEQDLRGGAALDDLSLRDRMVVLKARSTLAEASGNLVDWERYAHELLDLSRGQAEADPSNTTWQRDLSISQNNVGNVIGDQGDLAGALDAYRASLEIAQRLAERDPSNATWQRDLSISQNNVGNVLRDQGDLTGALEAYRASLEIAQRLAERDPSNTTWQRDLSVSQNNVGDVLREQGDLAGALDAYRASLEIRQRLS